MKVYHMNGAGNDFMVVDGRGQQLDYAKLAVELCTLRGADGFMAVDTCADADFRLHFYNSDGSRGEMCGNGARCICRFANEIGLAGPEMTVRTDAGLLRAWSLGGGEYRVGLNLPGVLDLHRKNGVAYVELGCPGVPHAVAEHEGDLWAQSDGLRPEMEALRHDAAFPKGANVNYYRWIAPDAVQILTFERGVEDFTLACGTGSGSVACVLWKQGLLPNAHLSVHNRGGILRFTIEGQQEITALWMEGPTEITEILEL